MLRSATLVPSSDLARSAEAMVLRASRMVAESRDVARLFEGHGAMVYGRARRLLGNHEDAQETTQEVFVRVITGVEALPPSNEIVPWLCRITTNLCLNKLRDAHRRRELLDTRAQPGRDEPVVAGPELLAQARALFAGADEKQAHAAIYVYVDGMSHDEAAEMLGVSRRTVGNLLERFVAWVRAREAEQPPSAGGGSTT